MMEHMVLNIDRKKIKLIQLIMSIDDDNALAVLEEKASEFSDLSVERLDDLNKAVKPIRSNVTLEEIDKGQGYEPVSYSKFRSDADKLQIEEPIEELLSDLTK